MGSKFLALQNRPRDPFAQYLRDHRRELLVPEKDILLLTGPNAHSPANEGRCHCGGRIDRRSLLYCPACNLSGFEDRLAEQRRIAPPIARRRPHVVSKVPKKSKTKPARKARGSSRAKQADL